MTFISLIALYLAYVSTPRKKLQFSVFDNVIINYRKSLLDNLTILYNNEKIDKVVVTQIAFWNISFPTINHDDIVTADPLKIIVQDGNVLDGSILYGEETSNSISISKYENSISIIFDYLDRKDGGVIQIIHTGTSVKIEGKIKGGKVKKMDSHYFSVFSGIALCEIIFLPYIFATDIIPIDNILSEYILNNINIDNIYFLISYSIFILFLFFMLFHLTYRLKALSTPNYLYKYVTNNKRMTPYFRKNFKKKENQKSYTSINSKR